MNKFDVTIIGAGIVGLATGLKLLEKKNTLKIAIVEKENAVAKHQTGNNSGVIHSGIYYKPGSLKAINCQKGYSQMLEFSRQHNIKFEICGKVIVASSEQEIPYLEELYKRGTENGLKGLQILRDNKEINAIEPNVFGIKGIFVPQTGIIDYIEVSAKYSELLESLGASFFFNESVTEIVEKTGGIEVVSNQKTIGTKCAVNCCGLHSDRVARYTMDNLELRIIPFRGEYYKLKPEKNDLIKTLVYPVPDPAFPFLGVHFTRLIRGGVEAGPNAVLAFKREGYRKTDINFSDLFETLAWPGFRAVAKKYWKTGAGEFYRSYNKHAFVKALQKLIPSVTTQDLEIGGAGVRAQSCDLKGKLADDFQIFEHGNVINVCNAPSPAATASLAIGTTIAEKILSKF